MDAKEQRLEKKLENLLAQASAVAAEIQALHQGPGTPHYDQIELAAHAAGKRFSRMIQRVRAREVAAASLADAACPTCERKCTVTTQTRTLHSMDGPTEVLETVAHCRPCRRSFFPSAGSTRIRRPRIDAGFQTRGDGAECRDAFVATDRVRDAADARSRGFVEHDQSP